MNRKSRLPLRLAALVLLLAAACERPAPTLPAPSPAEQTQLAAPTATSLLEPSPTQPPPAVTAPLETAGPATEAPSPAETTAPGAETPTPETPAAETPTVETPAPEATAGALPPLTFVRMLDIDNGWGLTEGQIQRTTDGGTTWTNVSPEGGFAPGTILTGFFPGADYGWTLVPLPDFSGGTLYRTLDGGATWTTAAVPFAGAAIFFLDPDNGWALDATNCGAGSCGGAIYRTSDGGAAWTQVSAINAESGGSGGLPLSGAKSGISFRDQNGGWVGGAQPQDGFVWLYATADGGAAWTHVDLTLPAGYETAQTWVEPPLFFSAEQGLLPITLLTEGGVQVFYRSSDGGASWTAGAPVANNGLYDCASFTHCFIWDGARLDATADSGVTWTTLNPPLTPAGTLLGLDFVDAATGFALSRDENGTSHLYRTADGGATWTETAG